MKSNNPSFFVKTEIDHKNKIVIKRFENPYKMKRYIRILAYLNALGFPVNEIIDVDFNNNIIKLKYIEGFNLSEIYFKMEKSDKQKILNSFARLIYKLHTTIKAKILIPFSEYIKIKYKQRIESLKNKNKIVYRFSKQLINTIDSKITELSLIHGDLNLKNVIIDENYNIVGILDWECAEYFDPLYDLAIFEVFNFPLLSKEERMYFIKKYLDLANISYSYYHQIKIPYQYLRLLDLRNDDIDDKIIEEVISMIETSKNIDILKFLPKK